MTEPFKAIEAATPGQIALIFQSAGLPADSMLLEDIDTSGGPVFNVTQAGKVFFGRSGHWIRWREREGDLRLDGEQVGVGRRSGKDGRPDGYRAYSLTDIEQMAHALAQNGAIDGTQLLHTLRVVQAMARIYGYLPPEWEPEPVVGDDELD